MGILSNANGVVLHIDSEVVLMLCHAAVVIVAVRLATALIVFFYRSEERKPK